eukprot:2554388-Amphidinium_carterae.1
MESVPRLAEHWDGSRAWKSEQYIAISKTKSVVWINCHSLQDVPVEALTDSERDQRQSELNNSRRYRKPLPNHDPRHIHMPLLVLPCSCRATSELICLTTLLC